MDNNPLVRIIDDDADARSATSFFLSVMGWEIREYQSAADFLENDDGLRPGCLVLDIRMPEMTGMELQLKLREKNSDLPIIFLSGHGDIDMAVHALKRGAFDFQEKNTKPVRLQAAVCRAVKDHLKLRAQKQATEEFREIYESLTPREKEVALRIAKGELNKVIAYDLGISERTVKMHRSNIFRKLNVSGAVEMLAFLGKIGVTNA